ncbi:MAG: endonuclease/exonuclease/phosphatase family protein [Candidatus Neomarinimicrobiota bacterium]
MIIVSASACEPLVTTFEEVEEAQYYQSSTLTSPSTGVDTLLIMTWNIKYGGGDIDFWWACYDDRVLMTEAEVMVNLEAIAARIRQMDPDILLMQEVDVQSKRTAYVDEMQYLLDYTDLNYGVYASMWRTQYAPSDGLGRADLGPAILSRWELRDAERIGLELRTDQDALTRYFYLRRCIVKAEVAIAGWEPYQVVNVHAAAFSQDGTKRKHIARFKDELDAIRDAGGLFVAGGDLNALPPGSQRVKDFPDTKCAGGDFESGDYSPETDWLNDLYGDYAPAIPIEEYQLALDQSPYYSYGDKPDSLGFSRKLDYLFTNSQWVPGSGTTHQDIASEGTTLSDHAPISVRLVLESANAQ